MNPKTLLILTALTVLLALGGLALDSSERDAPGWEQVGEPLYADLEGRLESITSLVIESAEGTTTVSGSGSEWSVEERSGYPGRADEVGRLLVGLASATRVEPKTSQPDNYERLGLAGFDDEDSPTVRLTARAGDEVVADLFLGNRRFRGSAESWFVRAPDEETTWAVEGKLRVPKRTTEWLQTQLPTVARDRIVQAHVVHADGERIELGREDPSATGFSLLNLPEGRQAKSESSAPGLIGALDNLRIQDVAPAAEAPEATPDTVTTFWTADGLQVRCELWVQAAEGDEPEVVRCRFTPSIDESRAPAATAGPELAPEEGEAVPAAPDPRQDLEQELEGLLARTQGWVYTLPSWKKSSFTTTMEELLEELSEEEQEALEDGPPAQPQVEPPQTEPPPTEPPPTGTPPDEGAASGEEASTAGDQEEAASGGEEGRTDAAGEQGGNGEGNG